MIYKDHLSAAWVKFSSHMLILGNTPTKIHLYFKQFMFETVKWFIVLTRMSGFIS